VTTFSLGLTLSLVGPRQDLLDKPAWPMALRVAIGTAAEPISPAAGADLILPTLPWMVWPDALPEVVVVDQTGTEIARCKPEPPLADNEPFLDALRTTVRGRGERLALLGRLTFSFDGKHQELQDKEDVPAVSWPGLMNTLNTLSQPTPSALKGTWFFNVERDRLAALDADGNWQLKPGLAISASPASVMGANHTGAQPGLDPTVHVHSYSSADVLAHCQLLGLEDALAHGVDELDNYWLSIRDSRDDSLLDLAARLETALGPGVMLSGLSIDEWTDACVSWSDVVPLRAATVGETKAVLELWKGRVKAESNNVADRRRRVIRDALLSDDDTVQAIREGYLERALETLRSLQDVAQTGIRTKVRSEAVASLLLLLRERLLPAFTVRDPSPCQPDEGIELVVGDDRMRLRHENQATDPAVDDVAAIQFFGRRSSEAEALDAPDETSTVDWHALTGARYAVPSVDGGDTLVVSTDRVLGVTAGYVDEVLYRELTYSGANLVCRNPLERVHRENLTDDEVGMMLAQLQRRASPTWELRALPLRYGDHYEFAASVIDRAGGLAAELCLVDQPWAFDPTSLARLAPPQRDRVRFLRRVAVGHCNILPSVGGWPQTPDEVWLRCLEEAAPPAENVGRPTSVLLVPGDRNAFRAKKAVGKATEWPASVVFSVEAPRLDEHTLLRWSMPATTLTPVAQKVALDALIASLTAIHQSRDGLLADGGSAEAGGLPFDPAVTALGVRYRFDGQAERQYVLPTQSASITVACGDADRSEVDTNTHALRFVVAPGSYVRLGFVPLIAPDDFERMDAEALTGLLEHQPEYQPWITGDGRKYGAFAESVVFAESASAELPKLLSDYLLLEADKAGNVDVRYAFSHLDAAGQRRLRNVHQMRISCERWVWRNLPVPSKDAVDAKTSPAERRRRLASGPPPEIMDAARRDAPDSELVSYFDELAGIDQGFVRREEVVLRFPRSRSDELALYVDQRDGITTADYLRFHLALRSRYRGVLVTQDGDAVGPRRIAVPFRGNTARIKPPKLLAVLPLIRAMGASPRATEKGAGSAFLVVLDEPWFREYGMGERLRARVAHVKAEIGETTEPPEQRYGPLPDHSVTPLKSADLDRMLGEDLDCFGPFGFSLDRGSSQTMANATGFVVYPPAGTPPHYNLFVEFSRLLDVPSAALLQNGTRMPLEGARSDALPLYTLPDSDALNPRSKSLMIARLGHGKFSFDAAEVASAPFAGATGEVLLQYRYLMIVGKLVRDSGRAVNVFLPQDGLWLSAGDLRLLGGTDRDIGGCNAAVIAEVLLNGRPVMNEPLGGANSLRDFFLMMFGATDEDAPGMIRRFSQVFDITFR
jgi:hypothetical protein